MSSTVLLFLTAGAYTVGVAQLLLSALSRGRIVTRALLITAFTGLALHTASLGVRWAETGYFPAVGLRDVASFLAWTIVLVFLVLHHRMRVPLLAVAALPLALGLTLVAALTPNVHRNDPLLRSLYLPVHTVCAFFGYGALFVACVMGVFYLIQERELQAPSGKRLSNLLPSLERCDTLAARSVAVGLVFLSLTIVTGLMWSHAASDVPKNLSFKEVAAYVTWVVYLGLLITRHRSGWGGRRAAQLAVLGFVLLLLVFGSVLFVVKVAGGVS
jgi:ABC-type uncharacterized transport system permease subunit